MFRLSSTLLLSIAFISAVFTANAKTTQNNAPYTELALHVSDLQKRYQSLPTTIDSSERLDQLILELAKDDLEADDCIQFYQTQFSESSAVITSLGEAINGEAKDLHQQRQRIQAKTQALEEELARCRLIKIQTESLMISAVEDKQSRIKARLLLRDQDVLSVVTGLAESQNYRVDEHIASVKDLLEKLLIWHGWLGLLLSFAVGSLMGIFWLRWEAKHREKVIVSSETWQGILRGFARTAPWLLGVVSMQLFLLLDQQAPLVVRKVTLVLLLMFLVFAAIRGLLTFDFIGQDEERRPFLNRLRYLSWLAILVTTVNYLFNLPPFDSVPNPLLNYVIWFGSLLLSVLVVIALLRMLSHSSTSRSRPAMVVLLTVTLLIPVVLGGIGLRNLAAFILFGVYATMLISLAFFLFAKVGPEWLDSVDSGKLAWHRNFKLSLGLLQQQTIPGLIWIRLLLFVTLLAAAVYLLFIAWGASPQQLNVVATGLLRGFDAGGVHFDPLRLMLAVLFLVLVFALLPLFKQFAVESWIRHTNLSRGAREATQTLVGYTWVAIGLMLALSLAGVNFQNIAIIAGALSVGIGFGLQNIVNNFVSGLILLFERPVRRGDWVEVGGTEGYVRDISIRSTTIETFERADVIVPNSELISKQVTNWVLKDTFGRMVAPIGVGYDSDPIEVIKILEEIAQSHPEVISDRNDFPIKAYFRRFGDSALEFELRCFLRDVDSRTRILHEVNLEIFRQFKQAKIDIPFPQRTVHLSTPLPN